jgi:hypothetical protein
VTNLGKAFLLAGGILGVTLGATFTTRSAVVQAMKPLLVRDFNAPAARPLQFELCTELNLGGFCATGADSFTVPESTASGEAITRFVIEYVSAECSVLPLTGLVNALSLATTAAGITVDHYFLPTSDPSYGVIGIAQDTRLYADPGTEVDLSNGWASVSSAICSMTISGHLVVE